MPRQQPPSEASMVELLNSTPRREPRTRKRPRPPRAAWMEEGRATKAPPPGPGSRVPSKRILGMACIIVEERRRRHGAVPAASAGRQIAVDLIALLESFPSPTWPSAYLRNVRFEARPRSSEDGMVDGRRGRERGHDDRLPRHLHGHPETSSPGAAAAQQPAGSGLGRDLPDQRHPPRGPGPEGLPALAAAGP